jgi:hypothetical protein
MSPLIKGDFRAQGGKAKRLKPLEGLVAQASRRCPAEHWAAGDGRLTRIWPPEDLFVIEGTPIRQVNFCVIHDIISCTLTSYTLT